MRFLSPQLKLEAVKKVIKSGRSLMIRVASIAAAFIFTLGISYSAYSYSTPYSYVGIDINPSIRLTANIFDRIIGSEALNADGKTLLYLEDINNKRLEAVISQLLNSAVEKGWIKIKPRDRYTYELTEAGLTAG